MSEENPFSAIVGASHTRRAGPEDAIDGVRPTWVVDPADIDEAAAVIRVVADRGLSLVARGRGQHLGLGEKPRRLDLLLSSHRLDAIIDHQPADMTVRVGAGCTLATLGHELERCGQWLPLDPRGAGSTTIGGLLATNRSGALRTSQGTARDFVIGMRTIGADGSVVSGGGTVVKNVAGYDLPKMHIGALGSLGWIAEATFKVLPRPRCEEAMIVACDDARTATELALELRDLRDPLWMQLVRTAATDYRWSLRIGVAGRAEEVEDGLARYRAALGDRGQAFESGHEATSLRSHPLRVRTGNAGMEVRLAILPDRTGHWLEATRAAAARLDLSVELCADPAVGTVRADFEAATDPVALLSELRHGIEREGGALVIEYANPEQKEKLRDMGGVWGSAEGTEALLDRLKQTFDPHGLFSPGRFVGGI